jgi:hypothetical protein
MTQSRGSEVLALGVARGLSLTAAAEEAGVSRATATRRRAEPEFAKQVSAFRAELFDRAAGQLADATMEAVDALRVLLKSDSEALRLRSAVALLDAAPRYRESGELADRLQNTETYIAGAGDGA